jgi:radical SAM protein with 4Fe4S-binding SPASM domain
MKLLERPKKWLFEHSISSPFMREMVREITFSNFFVIKTFLERKLYKINDNLTVFPPKLILESTNMCNAACTMCPYPKMMRRKGIMSFELFKKIIDEYSTSSTLRRVQMNNIGEPLLDSLLIKKVKYAKGKGIDQIFCFSNASLLDKKTSEDLIDAGLDYMIISTDGTNRESYEKIRKNLKFNDVIENVRNFLIIREKNRANKPKIELHITISNENRLEEKKFVKSMRGLADYVSITHAHNWAGQQETKSVDLIQKNKKTNLAPCSNLWSELTILWDGRVALCCLDYEGKIILGDIKEESLKNIWNGKRIQAIRQSQLKSQFNQELCKTCSEHRWSSWWLNYWD